MSPDRIIGVLVTLTLAEMMVVVGLQVTLADLSDVLRDWKLVARATLANYLVVPGMTLGLMLLFHVNPVIATAFLIVAACPGAPHGPPLAGIARADVGVSVGLMVILAGSSALISPVLLKGLLPWLSGGEAGRLDVTAVLQALLITQLLPLLVGVLVGQRYRPLADRLIRPLGLLSKILNAVVVVVILGSQFPVLMEIRPIGFVGMLILLAGSLLTGWLAGGLGTGQRRSTALATALRNVGVGLVIVTSNLAGSPAVSAALVYGLVQIFGSTIIALWWGRRG